MSNPRKKYWEAVKWVLLYLRGIAKLGLVFQRLKTGKPRLLQSYVDADYAGDLDQRRSTMGYVFTIAEYIISWKVELQEQLLFQRQRRGT